jgi:hypothetical protein
MEAFLLTLAAIHIVGLLIVFVAAARAPAGYEDERGFHPSESDPATVAEWRT